MTQIFTDFIRVNLRHPRHPRAMKSLIPVTFSGNYQKIHYAGASNSSKISNGCVSNA